MAEVRRLLTEHPLVTLTGPGGSGKTRLALEVAGVTSARYADGTWWVDLSPLADATMVPRTVAAVLEIVEQPGKPLATSLIAYLLPRRILLILDNCEHVLGVTADLAERLLRVCPELRILATSREPLRVPGERFFAVPPLGLPGEHPTPALDDLASIESVRLFVERARAHDPSFALTQDAAPAVAAICTRLDGLPLAIELAASRIRTMPLQEMATRLDRRLQLLSRGARTALPRHQTLRAAIAWSHDLLDDSERELFRRLSVFAGGCTMEAIESVCAAGAGLTPAIDLLGRLVDKSLVILDASSGRYRMLETIREYAQERLVDSGEAEQTRGRHRDYYLALAQRVEPELRGPRQQEWFRILNTEHDNLRAALDWSIVRHEVEAALRLAGALWRFWNVYAYWTEGQQWLERAMALDLATASAARAKAAFGVGVLAWFRGDYAPAGQLLDESLRLSEAMGDHRLAADAMRQLSLVASSRGQHERARHLAEASLHRFEELGDRWGIAASSRLLGYQAGGRVGYHHMDRIDLDAAARFLERSLALARELNDRRGIGWSLLGQAVVAWKQRRSRDAIALSEQALEAFRQVGDRSGITNILESLARACRYAGDFARAQAVAADALAAAQDTGEPAAISAALHIQGMLAVDAGDGAQAEEIFRRSIRIAHGIGNTGMVADDLSGMARGAAVQRRWKRAATLLEAGATLRRAAGAVPDIVQEEIDNVLITVRAGLGESVYAGVQTTVARMTGDEIVAFALAEETPTGRGPDGAVREDALTERERQVAILVASGSSNREIAGTLFLSERTVESHIQHILNKLGFRSRAQIAAWAVANRLQ